MANNPALYFQQLRQLMEMMEKTNDTVSPSFSKLRQALDDNELDEMDAAEFKNIKAEFIDASTNYVDGIKIMESLKAPAKIIGPNINLKKHYIDYANATKVMTDSLDENNQKVDMKLFEESEKIQDDSIVKFNAVLTKILTIGQGR